MKSGEKGNRIFAWAEGAANVFCWRTPNEKLYLFDHKSNERKDTRNRIHLAALSISSFYTIDYRCEDGRFPEFASCMTMSNPDLISSSETRVNPGIRSWRKHISEWARLLDVRKPLVESISQKKWRAETLQPGLEFDNFKPRLESGIFKCISWINGSFLGGDNRGFLKEGVNT